MLLMLAHDTLWYKISSIYDVWWIFSRYAYSFKIRFLKYMLYLVYHSLIIKFAMQQVIFRGKGRVDIAQ